MNKKDYKIRNIDDVIDIYKKVGAPGTYESLVVYNFLRLCREGGPGSMSMCDGDIGLMITDRSVEVVCHDDDEGDFKTLVFIKIEVEREEE